MSSALTQPPAHLLLWLWLSGRCQEHLRGAWEETTRSTCSGDSLGSAGTVDPAHASALQLPPLRPNEVAHQCPPRPKSLYHAPLLPQDPIPRTQAAHGVGLVCMGASASLEQ